MINAMVTGRLGADPEVKHTQDGTAILKLSIASNSSKGKDEPPTWVRASLFGDRGKKLAEFLHKGDRVAVCGTVELRKWKTNDGEERTDLEMRVDQLDLIQERKDDDRRDEGRRDERRSDRREERRDDRRPSSSSSSSNDGGQRRSRF